MLGFIDWMTTVLGVLYFGAVEINPIFAGIVHSNILAFSGIKLSSTVLIGFLFYQGGKIEKMPRINSFIGKRFLMSGYIASLLTFSVVVVNNIMAVARIF